MMKAFAIALVLKLLVQHRRLSPKTMTTSTVHRGRDGQGDRRLSPTSAARTPRASRRSKSGIDEIDDAKRKMRTTADIKLDKDFSVILISRY